MKKVLVIQLFLLVVLVTQAQRSVPNLIISEICMGVDPRYSYAEISNIGSDTADLSEVYISVSTNAGADFHRSSQVNTTWRLDDPSFRKRVPGNKLAPGQTALIVNNLVTENDIGNPVQLVPPFYWAHADIITLEVMELNGTSPLRFFGGDDALFLVWDKNGDGQFNWEQGVDQILDLVGNSADYGGIREVYDIAGVTDATLDNVIIRKAEVESGNAADFTSTRGSNPEDSEWIVMPWDPKTSSLFLPSAGHHISFRELQNYQPDTIRYGDILMRSLRVHPKDIMDTHNTLATAKEFHVDKIMWIYENNARYNEQVRNEGILIGTAMSHNAFEKWYNNSTIDERDAFVEEYTIVDLNGAQVLPAHMESFTDGFVRHFEPDQSDPEWLAYYTEYVYYLYQLGIDGLHRDDPAINSGAPRIGGTFTAPAIEYFRNYLQQNYNTQELTNLGVDNIETFNVKDHFLDLGAPVGDTFWRWRGSPLMPVYLEAMRQADREFFLQLKSVVENRTGIKVPWSLNGSGPLRPHEEAFDYRIGEFQFHHNQPQTMMIMSEYVRKAGIKQAYVGIVDRNYETKPGHVAATRKHIATAYATGTIPLVPWDMYMHDAPRYFGTYSEYGDLYKFVSDNRNLLDDYEAVSASGIDMQAGLYSWFPISG